MMGTHSDTRGYPRFNRDFFESDERLTVIGEGQLGGKALGLALAKRTLETSWSPADFPNVRVEIPRMVVIGTEVFEAFMDHNALYAVALEDSSDERVVQAFLKAELPPQCVGDLRALIACVHRPLAVRSSGLLEDALNHPFAGVYATKMIPNNQAAVGERFRRLCEAIKYVWASTFFQDAKNYMRTIDHPIREERMAIIIQEIVGDQFDKRFYPIVSGVVRSHNCYPTGPAAPEDGVVSLALGLGKTIVDGGVCWTYSPRFPKHGPPYCSTRDLVDNTQTRFWSVSMEPAPYDPINEAEHLVQSELDVAEWDDVLRFTASTYDHNSDRLTIGTGVSGARVLTFGRILQLEDLPLNSVLVRLADCFKTSLGADVEIEFAATFDPRNGLPLRLGFLQVRPMMVAHDSVEILDEELHDQTALVVSNRVLGNGITRDVADIVYVKPSSFDSRNTTAIAGEIASFNTKLMDRNRPYLLIGFGRWGSSDPWLGIPSTWPQICGARAIVEATLPGIDVDASQGSHFFHNMTSFGISYFTVRHSDTPNINWGWLDRQQAVSETLFVRHVHLDRPLDIRVDGRRGRGIITHD